MTTATNTTVIVGADGLIKVCSWCTPRAKLEELSRLYDVTHGICNICSAKLEAGATA
jgi:hypothetical protein